MKNIKKICSMIFLLMFIFNLNIISCANSKVKIIDFSSKIEKIEKIEKLMRDVNDGKYEKVYLKEEGLFSKKFKKTVESSEIVYYGEIKNDQPHGIVIMYTEDGDYMGNFKKGKVNGFGIVDCAFEKYEGEFKDNKITGEANVYKYYNFTIDEKCNISSSTPIYSGEWKKIVIMEKVFYFLKKGI